MSEIGTNGSTIALTSRNTDRPGDPKPLVKSTNPAATGSSPLASQGTSAIAPSVEKPEEGDDLSIRALIEGDPLDKAGKALEKFIPDVATLPNTKLRIQKNDETGMFVYQSIDNESGEIVRQFPPEDLLEFLAFYQELKGKVVDDEV